MIGKANNLRNTIDLHYPLQLKNVSLRVTKRVLKTDIEVEYLKISLGMNLQRY